MAHQGPYPPAGVQPGAGYPQAYPQPAYAGAPVQVQPMGYQPQQYAPPPPPQGYQYAPPPPPHGQPYGPPPGGAYPPGPPPGGAYPPGPPPGYAPGPPGYYGAPQMAPAGYGPPPGGFGGAPPVGQGVELLAAMDKMVVKQKIELLELVTGCETENKYNIYNTQGFKMFKARERSGCCQRQCCGSCRGWDIEIRYKKQINPAKPMFMRLHRDCACFFFDVEVHDERDQLIGHVKRDCSCCTPAFHTEDAQGQRHYEIVGPCCWCCEAKFPVLRGAVEEGFIQKKFSGLLKEMFTDADNFVISFPESASPHERAVLVGGLFLIDFVYFENNNRRNNNQGAMFYN